MIYEEEKSRLPLIVLVVGVIAATVALTLFVSGRVGGPSQSGQEVAGTDPATTTGGLDESDTTIPVTAPETTWTVYIDRYVPSSPTAGPAEVDGSVSRGFAHTPIGALMAASRFSTILPNASDWESVLAENVDPGQGVEAYRAMRQEFDAQTRDLVCSTNPPGDENCANPNAVIHRPTGGDVKTIGFEFVSYSDSQAQIRLHVEAEGFGHHSAAVTVRWHDNDWKLQLLESGKWGADLKKVTGPVEGLVAWGPDYS